MGRKIAVMQPYFFPHIGYFQLINASNKFVLYDDVNYINKGWINRNFILNNFKPELFTIPLSKASQNKLIKDISIDNVSDWRKKFLKKLEHNYSKAPFYGEVFSLINEINLTGEQKITGLVHRSLMKILEYLNLKKEIVESSVVYNNRELKGEMRIIDICRIEEAGQYINPIGGTELYNTKLFAENNIKLSFIKTKEISYKQFGDTFTDKLSMIDVLMFNSKEKVCELLNEYELTENA